MSWVDFESFDIILAMDKSNLANLQAMKPDDYQGHLGLFLEFSNTELEEVPDPFHDDDGFQKVLDLVEEACDGLLTHVQTQQK